MATKSIGDALGLRDEVDTAIALIDDGGWTVHGLDAAGAVLLAHHGHYQWTVFPNRYYRHPAHPPTDPTPAVVLTTQSVMREHGYY